MSKQSPSRASSAVDEILKVEQAHVEAFNNADLDKVLSYFAPEINGFSSTHNDRYRGRDELRKTFEYYLQKSDRVFYEISEVEVEMLAGGENALVTFYWKAAPLVNAEEEVITGRATHILARKDGQWQIIHEHFSRAH